VHCRRRIPADVHRNRQSTDGVHPRESALVSQIIPQTDGTSSEEGLFLHELRNSGALGRGGGAQLDHHSPPLDVQTGAHRVGDRLYIAYHATFEFRRLSVMQRERETLVFEQQPRVARDNLTHQPARPIESGPRRRCVSTIRAGCVAPFEAVQPRCRQQQRLEERIESCNATAAYKSHRARGLQAQYPQQLLHRRLDAYRIRRFGKLQQRAVDIQKKRRLPQFEPGRINGRRVLAGKRFAVRPHAPQLYGSKDSGQYKKAGVGVQPEMPIVSTWPVSRRSDARRAAAGSELLPCSHAHTATPPEGLTRPAVSGPQSRWLHRA